MATIKLLGEAGRTFTREVELDIQTVGEAVRALCAIFPGFEEWVLDADARGIGWRVIVDDPKGVSEEQLRDSVPVPKRLILAPIIRGKGPILLIVAGIALIGTAIFVGVSTILGGILLSVGLSLLFQGIAALLSPTALRKKALEKKSYLFTGNNLQAVQGLSMPIVYGEALVTAAPVISFGIFLGPNRTGSNIELLKVLDRDIMPHNGGFWAGPYDTNYQWFSTRLLVRFPVGGLYKIEGSADDDINFYVDGTFITGEQTGYAGPTVSDTRSYTAGIHEVKIELRNTILGGSCTFARISCVQADDGDLVNPLDIAWTAVNYHNETNDFRYKY